MKMFLERDPCLLDWRKAIPGLDRFLEFTSLVDDVVGLLYFLRVRIEKIFNVTIFEQVFDFFKDIVDWSDRFIMNFCYFFFKIVQLTQ